jgi:hypothetical protein
MADTTTTNLSLVRPELGASADSWGTKLNSDLSIIDAIFASDGSGTSVGLNVGTTKALVLGGDLKIGGSTVLSPATPLPIANGGTGQTTATNVLNAILPTQTGNSGKYLTTNGSSASWGSASSSAPGSNMQIPYNNSGTLAGSFLYFDNTLGYNKLGINTGSPSYTVDGPTALVRFGGLAINGTPTSGQLYVGGNGVFTGSVTTGVSDERLKKDIAEIENALDKVKSLRAFTYELKEDSQGREVGVSAQEVRKVLPEAVAPAPFDALPDGTSASGENYLTVHYERLVPLLIAAVKELAAKVEGV